MPHLLTLTIDNGNWDWTNKKSLRTQAKKKKIGLSIAILKYNKYTNSNDKCVTKLNWTFFFLEKKIRKSEHWQQAKIEGKCTIVLSTEGIMGLVYCKHTLE